VKSRDLGFDFFFFLFARGVGNAVVGFVGVVQEREELEILGVRDGIEFVSVALAAADGQAQPRGAGGGDAVDDGVVTEFEGIDAAFFVEHGVAVKAGGDEVVWRGVRKKVAGDLFDRELIEGHIGVEGFDDPVPVGPDNAAAVFFVAVGVGVTREVEPAARPAFTVLRRGEQCIDETLVAVGSGVFNEGIGFRERGGHAGEIEMKAPRERVAIGFRGLCEAVFFELSENVGIDGIVDASGV